jgi:hypothetical protein
MEFIKKGWKEMEFSEGEKSKNKKVLCVNLFKEKLGIKWKDAKDNIFERTVIKDESRNQEIIRIIGMNTKTI